MNREVGTPRANLNERLEHFGFTYHTVKGQPYWNEAAAYRFEPEEISALESATNELHQLCLAAVEHVLRTEKLNLLHIPEAAHAVIVQAWEADPPAIYGRFDLCYDGSHPPKLLEYNADTPTSLLEAAVIQWHWLQEVHPNADQFNSIWEGLVAKWQSLKLEGCFPTGRVHFGCEDSMEDLMTTAVMMDTAHEAGLEVVLLQMLEIGWHQINHCFVDKNHERIETLFKLYPWEFLLSDRFGSKALQTYYKMQWIEPIWKMVLSNKGILAVLWALFPNHPNLLPAYFDGPRGMDSYVEKPMLGREGANVKIVTPEFSTENPGPYQGPSIFQAYQPLPVFDGNHAVMGSWVIDGEARGIGIRESDGPITEDLARFVPHYFVPGIAAGNQST